MCVCVCSIYEKHVMGLTCLNGNQTLVILIKLHITRVSPLQQHVTYQ